GLGGESWRAGRHRLDLVKMHRGCVEHVQLTSIHGMFAARFGEPDTSAEADFPSFGIFANAAARRSGDDLKAPARAEYGRAGLKRGLDQFDLAHHFRSCVIDVQA